MFGYLENLPEICKPFLHNISFAAKTKFYFQHVELVGYKCIKLSEI